VGRGEGGENRHLLEPQGDIVIVAAAVLFPGLGEGEVTHTLGIDIAVVSLQTASAIWPHDQEISHPHLTQEPHRRTF
jgi:hypothetical protein